MVTNIHNINIGNKLNDNCYYIKREDQFGGSFGGNKVRKAAHFFREILDNKCDHVVTYGSKYSNHCRAVAEMCARHGLKCTLIMENTYSDMANFNYDILQLLEVDIIEVENVGDNIKNCINETIENLNKSGFNPYFIPGGGHGVNGTAAYVEVYDEIVKYEQANNIEFDYIFCCLGTGTTYAGLIAGEILNNNNNKHIVGISNARSLERCNQEVILSLREYFSYIDKEIDDDIFRQMIEINEDYIGDGYGISLNGVAESNQEFYRDNGILFDEVYMGKVLFGMRKYIEDKGIHNSNILLIHTGGLPLAFNTLRR